MMVGHEIIPGLYQRGMFKRYSLPRKLALLESANIGLVVCMIKDKDEELEVAMPELGLTYLWCPIPDGKLTPEDLRHVGWAASEVSSAILNGQGVIVHCRAGRNRSALVSALAVREMERTTGREAIDIVRIGRPNSLANEHFVAYLEGLDA